MVRLALVCVILASTACKKKESGKTDTTAVKQDAQNAPQPGDAPGAPTGSPPAAVDQTARGKQILDAQVAALRQTADDSALRGTFDPDAVVLVPQPRSAQKSGDLRGAIARLDPGATLEDIKVDKLVVGGNADALWLSAELTFAQESENAVVRVTELATAASNWKVVAGAFSEAAPARMGKNPPANSRARPTLDR